MHMHKNIILKQHGQLSCFQLSGIVSLLQCLRKLHYLAVVKRIKGFYLNQNYFQIIHNAMSIDTNIVFHSTGKATIEIWSGERGRWIKTEAFTGKETLTKKTTQRFQDTITDVPQEYSHQEREDYRRRGERNAKDSKIITAILCLLCF